MQKIVVAIEVVVIVEVVVVSGGERGGGVDSGDKCIEGATSPKMQPTDHTSISGP